MISLVVLCPPHQHRIRRNWLVLGTRMPNMYHGSESVLLPGVHSIMTAETVEWVGKVYSCKNEKT